MDVLLNQSMVSMKSAIAECTSGIPERFHKLSSAIESVNKQMEQIVKQSIVVHSRCYFDRDVSKCCIQVHVQNTSPVFEIQNLRLDCTAVDLLGANVKINMKKLVGENHNCEPETETGLDVFYTDDLESKLGQIMPTNTIDFLLQIENKSRLEKLNLNCNFTFQSPADAKQDLSINHRLGLYLLHQCQYQFHIHNSYSLLQEFKYHQQLKLHHRFILDLLDYAVESLNSFICKFKYGQQVLFLTCDFPQESEILTTHIYYSEKNQEINELIAEFTTLSAIYP